MPSKFFTNQDNNTLENRLTDILKNYDIKSIEFLLGYFRISGFKKISQYLSNIEKTRILVGINIDKLTLDAKERGKTLNINDNSNFTNEFRSEQEAILKKSQYSKEVDESMQILSDMLINNKLEIKISKEKNIHAKVYILREKDIQRHNGTAEYRGSIITGSSNLSENGLTKNYEFNVELKDSDDIEFGLKEFDKLWDEAVDISESDIESIKNDTYLKEVSPYELYLKFLIEHFENRVEYDPSVANDLPSGFMKLAYQIDAVNDGLDKIAKHNGFFLSDVVGLGKTVTATMIVRRLLESTKGAILIIAPPSIKDEWEETFNLFKIKNMRGYKFVSNGSLNKIKDISSYETIIIDESHKFKNWSTNRYSELEKITKENSLYTKKVILISATPLNNKPEDIANQLYLFQDSRNSTIDSFPNLKEFFANINERFKKIIGKKPVDSLDPNFVNIELTPTEKADLEDLSKELGSKILREVMVRRTRTDIQTNKKYKEDMESQGLTIPKSNPVEMVEYQLDDKTLVVFNRTIDILSKELKYARYMLLAKLGDTARAEFKLSSNNMPDNIFEVGAKNLADIIRVSSLKALECSFVALKSMLSNQKKSLEHLIKMFESNEVYVSKDVNIYDMLDKYGDDFADKYDELLSSDKKVSKFSKDDFAEDYVDDLKYDLSLINSMLCDWKSITVDPKLEKLNDILDHNKKQKIVVFTESKQTALYLGEQLGKNNTVLTVTGDNRDKLKDTIRENFDANYKTQKDDYNVIITTDTLSEGVNMHRSNIIYNYDIPWNSTRLMQRIGRINRIGTKHTEIFIYNFKPTAESEKYIELSKKAFTKLQTFHDALGEDSQIYSTDEKVGSKSLYNQDSYVDIDKELKFLEEIRDVAENNRTKYNEIKKLSNKIRVQRKSTDNNAKSFVFIKNNNSKNYYKISDDNKTDLDNNAIAVDFVEMAENLQAETKEKPVLPIQEIHYTHVSQAYQRYDDVINNLIQKQSVDVLQHEKKSKDKKSLQFINKLFMIKHIDKSLKDTYADLLNAGRYQNLSKDIKAIEKGNNFSKAQLDLENLLKSMNIQTNNVVKSKVINDMKIILSETFV
ncbi:MAG: superfamily II DNA/RNA helicase [Francisella sp.]|jgi:superfamily II DNA/RNA helicase